MATAEQMGIRELKAHLSQCLARVGAGARLTVTDRGRAVAMLVPIDAPEPPKWVDALVRSGGARWTGGKPMGLAARIPRRGKPASAMVIEDRR
jgi:prevent-host-death family protein